MIYRGQAYGDPVGEWWTSSQEDAGKFAMAAGGNRTYVVLGLDEDDKDWLAQYQTSSPLVEGRPVWYRIPAAALQARWRGVRIVEGAIGWEEADDRKPTCGLCGFDPHGAPEDGDETKCPGDDACCAGCVSASAQHPCLEHGCTSWCRQHYDDAFVGAFVRKESS